MCVPRIKRPIGSSIYTPTQNRSLLLCLVVEKAKKCLDFGATLFIFHLLACWTYEVRGGTNRLHWIGLIDSIRRSRFIHVHHPACTPQQTAQSFPSTGLWWVIHIAGVTVMVLLGASVCWNWSD